MTLQAKDKQISASELRLGNLVTIDNPNAWPEMKGVPLRVTGIRQFVDEDFPASTGDVNLEGDRIHEDYCQFDEFIRPIALTSELLERFGFARHKFNFYRFSKGALSIILESKEPSFEGKVWINNSWMPELNLEYVHTLQNLYFAIHGKELTLKEARDGRDEPGVQATHPSVQVDDKGKE